MIELSCNKHSTYCIQLLLSLSADEDEQNKVSKYFRNHYVELAKDKQGAYVLKVILTSFCKNAKILVESSLIENIIQLSKNKYAIGLLKFFLNQEENNNLNNKNKISNLVEANIEEFLNNQCSHYLILYFIERWNIKDYEAVVISVLNKLPQILFNKYSARVLNDLIEKILILLTKPYSIAFLRIQII